MSMKLKKHSIFSFLMIAGSIVFQPITLAQTSIVGTWENNNNLRRVLQFNADGSMSTTLYICLPSETNCEELPGYGNYEVINDIVKYTYFSIKLNNTWTCVFRIQGNRLIGTGGPCGDSSRV